MAPTANTKTNSRPKAAPGGPTRGRPEVKSRRRGAQLSYRFRDPRDPDYPFYSPYWTEDHTPNYSRVGEHVCRMKGFYKPSRYDGRVYFFVSAGGDPLACHPRQVWPKYLPNAEWVPIPGNHINSMFGRYAARLASEISERLKRPRQPRPD